jgi:hypothetical protein
MSPAVKAALRVVAVSFAVAWMVLVAFELRPKPAAPATPHTFGSTISNSVNIVDQNGNPVATDAGQLTVTGNITTSPGAGTQTVLQAADSGVLTTPALPYASVSQWYGASAGTVKEAGATIYAIACQNTNGYSPEVQLYNAVNPPVADAGPAFMQVGAIPAGTTANPGSLIAGAEIFTVNGTTLSTGLSFGVSQSSQWYNPPTAANVSCALVYK